MNKYHDGHLERWFSRMLHAGWRFWIWQDEHIMWRHADEDVLIPVKDARDLFKQFVNTGESYIPTPYEFDAG